MTQPPKEVPCKIGEHVKDVFMRGWEMMMRGEDGVVFEGNGIKVTFEKVEGK